jgi:hemimethylated DNA binding protein
LAKWFGIKSMDTEVIPDSSHKFNSFSIFSGVIVAWDEKAKAPEWWIRKVHGKEEIDEPNYTILIDTRGN